MSRLLKILVKTLVELTRLRRNITLKLAWGHNSYGHGDQDKDKQQRQHEANHTPVMTS